MFYFILFQLTVLANLVLCFNLEVVEQPCHKTRLQGRKSQGNVEQ